MSQRWKSLLVRVLGKAASVLPKASLRSGPRQWHTSFGLLSGGELISIDRTFLFSNHCSFVPATSRPGFRNEETFSGYVSDVRV
jgi:hypothetical protein